MSIYSSHVDWHCHFFPAAFFLPNVMSLSPSLFVVHRSDSHWSDHNKAIFHSFLMLPLCHFQCTHSYPSLDETRKMDTLVHLYWYNRMPVWVIYEGQTGICFLRFVGSERSKVQELPSAWTLLKEEGQKRHILLSHPRVAETQTNANLFCGLHTSTEILPSNMATVGSIFNTQVRGHT